MTRRSWTPEEDATLCAQRAQGKTHAQIAKLLSRPITSINSRLQTLNNNTMPRQAAEPEGEAAPPLRRKATRRPCMCCGNSFPSEGPHNRLCGRCRSIDVSPYALAI